MTVHTVRTELHRHPAVATLSTYIHWKMEDDHTYHNRQVHDNTIHHMVLTTYFSMHVRNLSKVLYLLCLWCLLTIVSSNSHTGLVWRFYSCVATAGCRCSSVRTVTVVAFTCIHWCLSLSQSWSSVPKQLNVKTQIEIEIPCCSRNWPKTWLWNTTPMIQWDLVKL